MENNSMHHEQKMNKKYIGLKKECDAKQFCIEAAISEYIDNSIQSILNDYADKNNIDEEIITLLENKDEFKRKEIIDELKKYNLTIKLEFCYEQQNNNSTSKIRTMFITDNACGIPNDKLSECMEMNKTLTRQGKRSTNSMNVYGVGMKNASFFIGNNAIIYTKTKNDNFISVGNYNAPLDINDNRMLDDVIMSFDRIYDDKKLFDKIGDSGTIIKVQAVTKKIFNKFYENDKDHKQSVQNILKTLGMKYSNYLNEKILNLKIITRDKNNQIIEENVPSNSMTEYEKNAICNPFVIDNFYEDHKERLSKQYDKRSFQEFLQKTFRKTCEENPKLLKLYNENQEFSKIFDFPFKPIVFKMNAFIKSQNASFPIKVGIMNKGEQAYSNVNILAQWRYINLPSFEKSSNSLIKQFLLSNKWSHVSCKWSFIEFDLKDLPKNNEFEYFNVDHNKTSFIDVKKDPDYTIDDIEDALKEVKTMLVPLTDIFKNCGDKVISSSYQHNEKTSDFISENIDVSQNNKDFIYTNPKTSKQTCFKINDNAIQSDELITRIDENNVQINTKNSILQLGESVSPKMIYVLNIFKENFNKLQRIKEWIKLNENLFDYAKDWNEIKSLIEENEEIETFEELLKNG